MVWPEPGITYKAIHLGLDFLRTDRETKVFQEMWIVDPPWPQGGSSYILCWSELGAIKLFV